MTSQWYNLIGRLNKISPDNQLTSNEIDLILVANEELLRLDELVDDLRHELQEHKDMFGKQQPDVVTEEDVGNFVAELERTTVQPIDEVMNDGFEEMITTTEQVATRSTN
jgi:hypothetical protein